MIPWGGLGDKLSDWTFLMVLDMSWWGNITRTVFLLDNGVFLHGHNHCQRVRDRNAAVSVVHWEVYIFLHSKNYCISMRHCLQNVLFTARPGQS